MKNIRPAGPEDPVRIAEIEIFNYRLNFYPIFKDDSFYFSELQVPVLAEQYRKAAGSFYVYDDGAVKGFTQIDGREIRKLFVEPVLQGKGIGADLLKFAVEEVGADFLWALEKNVRAIAFYQRRGFRLTGEKKLEKDTAEYLVRLIWEPSDNQRKKTMDREKSCGAVVYTKEDGGIRYVLAEQRSGQYSFPKGHVEAGETEEQTALREIWEETGLRPEFIPGFRDGETYEVKKKPGVLKDVVYFLAEYSGQSFAPMETDTVSVGLFTFEEALEKLPTDSRRNVLIRADEFLRKRQ